MKRWSVAILLCSALTQAAPTRVTLELNDGSRLMGTTSTTALKVTQVGQKTIDTMPVDQLHGFTVSADGKSLEVSTLTDATPLTVRPVDLKFEITGSYGKLQLPFTVIHSADLGEPEPPNGTARESLSFSCSELKRAEAPTETSGGSAHVVTLRFSHGANLLLTSVTRSETDKTALLAAVKAVQSCKAPKTIRVSTARFFSSVDTLVGPRKGWSTPHGNVTVE